MNQDTNQLAQVYAAAAQVFGRDNPRPAQLARDVCDFMNALSCYEQQRAIARGRDEAVRLHVLLGEIRAARQWRDAEAHVKQWVSRAVVSQDSRLIRFLTTMQRTHAEAMGQAKCDEQAVADFQDALDKYVLVLDMLDEELALEIQTIEGDLPIEE